MFFYIVMAVHTLGTLYIASRTSSIFSKPLFYYATWAGFLIYYCLLFLSFSSYRNNTFAYDSKEQIALSFSAYFLMGVSFVLLVGFLATDFFHLLTGIYSSISGKEINPQRRTLIRTTLLTVVTGSASLIGVLGLWQKNKGPQVKEVLIPIKNLPEKLEGFSLAQITDVHVGALVKKQDIEKIVEITNSLNVDVIAITGDLIDGSVSIMGDQLKPLANLKSRFGIYFVTGNHEYYWDIDHWLEHFRTLGLRVMENESVVLEKSGEKVLLSGVPDIRTASRIAGGFSSPKKARAGHPNFQGPKILLAHQPKSCHEAYDAGFDFMMCGHTHGGQFFPWNLFVRFAHPYWTGLNNHNGMWVYVNNGTGFWGPPNRFGVPSEISLFKLTKA